MAHALSAGELSILRENNQASELYLAIQNPTQLWSAEVNLPAAGWDNNEVWGVPYDTVLSGEGSENILYLGMTMYVGSSGSAVGAYDVGMVRVRNHPFLVTGTYVPDWGITGSYIPIGETSNIEWGDGMVITIVDEFQLWQKQKRLVDSSGDTVHWYDEEVPSDLYMDYDIVYNNHNVDRDPIPILGTHVIGWIPAIGGDVNVEFDASDSYVVGDGAASLSYVWQVFGAKATTDINSSSITLTYDTPGVYRVTCTITNDNNGRLWAGHRYVFIYDDNNLPATDFTLDECSGDWNEGGWSYKVTMYGGADLDTVRDKALCVLFAKDYYGTKEQYVGTLTDRENIISVGWIDGESINWNPNQGLVEFEIQGPHWWLNKITSWPSWSQDDQYELFDEEENQIEPYAWNLFSDMTVDMVMHQFLHWRSTITAVTDVYLTGDTRQIPDMNVSENNLWDQISNIVDDTIQAHPCCDRYGRLYLEIEPQVVLLSDRGSIPTVMDITKEDWRDRIGIDRRTWNEVSILDFSGIWYSNGTWDNECYEGGGSAFSQHGARVPLNRLLLYTTQDDNLEWCGLALSWMNNKYPIVSIPLSSNNRAIDICPHQYIELSIDELDTERGIIWE